MNTQKEGSVIKAKGFTVRIGDTVRAIDNEYCFLEGVVVAGTNKRILYIHETGKEYRPESILQAAFSHLIRIEVRIKKESEQVSM